MRRACATRSGRFWHRFPARGSKLCLIRAPVSCGCGGTCPSRTYARQFWRRSLNWTGLPLASPGLMIGFGLSSALHKWVFSDIWIRAGLRAEELRETLTALCFMLVMIECFRRASRVDLPAAGVDAPTP